MGAKARCSICRNYFLKEDMLRSGLGGLGGVCSEECFTAYKKKYADKRVRRKAHREAKYDNSSRRLPGTCRDRVKRRDDGKCRWCGTTSEIQIHHVRYRSEGGPDTPKNLISICASCHAKAHTDKGKYQPILLLWLWLYYEREEEVTVESCFRMVRWQQSSHGAKLGIWHAGIHQDWIDEARAFSNEVCAKKEQVVA